MDRVTMFSTTFPSYHPRKGQPTYFIEKMWAGLMRVDSFWWGQFLPPYMQGKYRDFAPKYHTIRPGHRYKKGDAMDARIWMDKPYRSKQRSPFESLIEISNTWDFDIINGDYSLNGCYQYALTGEGFDLTKLANNDGLNLSDFDDWFVQSKEYKKTQEFHGQVICWNPHLKYFSTDKVLKDEIVFNPNRKIIRMP